MTAECDTTEMPTKAPDFAVLVADQHLILAETVCAVLTEKSRCSAKGVNSLSAAFAAASEQAFDLLLYDCGLPGCWGLEALERLVSGFPDTGVVLFGECEDHAFLFSALKIGLRGYVPKSMPLLSFLTTVDLLKAGEVFVPARTIRAMNDRSGSGPARLRVLNDLECRLLGMIDAGLSNKEIGQSLGNSENQIKMKLRTLFSKVGANNRIHAVRIARNLGEV